jgi:Na+-transporting NADH:ubiquinone oxidoreductase subunit B
MLRKLLDRQLSLTEKGKPLHWLRPAISALDAFLYESPQQAIRTPYVRDAVDLKRWMILVVVALLPCVLVAIWNSGLQKIVYASFDASLMERYLQASRSLWGYVEFCTEGGRWWTIFTTGMAAFLPVLLISYLVGGLWELTFAIIRRHEVAEGFLVTGLLFPLTLPSTIPYWMVAVGVSFGVIVGKELFGGTGMNILNPALTCRIFLFFTFPAAMTGEVWVGTNPTVVAESLRAINSQLQQPAYDSVSQASPLALFNVGDEVRRIHVEAIAVSRGQHLSSSVPLARQFARWQQFHPQLPALSELAPLELRAFVTGSRAEGGLGLPADSYAAAYRFAALQYGWGKESVRNFLLGNRIGAMGETSVLAIVVGALFLLWVGLAAVRTMVGMLLGAYLASLLFELIAQHTGIDGGLWNPARYAFPAYKQLLVGGLAFGIVFMATDPVSSPAMRSAKWVYGIMAGAVTIVIRYLNPAYPEGTMLAILFANVFSPLLDRVAIALHRKQRLRRAAAIASL